MHTLTHPGSREYVQDPVAPTEVAFYDTPGRAVGVTLAERHAYVADRSGGLLILHPEFLEPLWLCLTLVMRSGP